MSEQQFDKLIKEKLAQQNYVPSADGFESIMQRVANTKTITPPTVHSKVGSPAILHVAKSRNYFRNIAAIVLPLVAIWGTYTFLQSTNKVEKNTASIENNIPNSTNATDPATEAILDKTLPSNNITKEVIQNNTTTIAYENGVKAIQDKLFKNIKKQHIEEILPKKNTIIYNNNDAEKKLDIVQTKIDTNLNESHNSTLKTNKEAVAVDDKSNHLPDLKKEIKQFLPLEIPNTKNKKIINNRTSISMVSGALVNSKNTSANSFQLGVNAEKNISPKFYVDASVIVSRNNPTWLQNQLSTNEASTALNKTGGYSLTSNTNTGDEYINAYGVNPSSNAFKAGGNNISMNELRDEQSIAEAAAYRLASTQIEVAPMIGFRLLNRLNIATGADAVRIFKTNSYNDGVKHLLLQSQQSNPILKTWDLGLIGKIEYKINKRIVVGYRHREGITNMTPGSGINTRRSYNGVLIRLKIR